MMVLNFVVNRNTYIECILFALSISKGGEGGHQMRYNLGGWEVIFVFVHNRLSSSCIYVTIQYIIICSESQAFS